MYLPRTIYELLPYAYVGGGVLLALLSWIWPGSAWADGALVLGTGGILLGLVVLMRRRTFRTDAERYDSRSLDDCPLCQHE